MKLWRTSPARARAAEGGWVENKPSSGWLPALDLGELWSYRELAYFLALRELMLRYKQTFFGVAWAIIQPLAAVLVFSVVFGNFAELPSDDIPYPVFVYAGTAIWTYVSTAVSSAAGILVTDQALVTRTYFPRILAPLAAILPGLLDLLLNLVLVGVFMVIYDVVPDAALVTLPLWVLAALGVAMGAGLWLAALNVQYRDVNHVLPFLLQVWLFASPLVYPTSLLDGWERYVYALNPMAGLLDGVRWSMLSGPAPGPEALISLATGVILLVTGVLYFRRGERRFADVI
jgi:lipopolysaccharide transport system permease protein